MDNATIVYDGEFDLSKNKFLTIHFATPYTYNGGNLLIGFYEYQKEGNMSSPVAFYGVESGKSIGRTNSSSLDDVQVYSRTFQPKTTFLYEAARIDINDAVVSTIPEQRWSNSPATPAFTVTYNDEQLVEDTDYVVEYSDNVNVGTATVTITGMGNYTDTKAVTFTIADFPLLNPESANSADNPYLISTEEDLKALAGIVNSGARNDGFYKQTGDITLTKEHIAIGYNNENYNTYPYAFKGTYDGDSKSVKNMTISKQGSNDLTDGYLGFFGYLMGATIQNVRVENCNIAAYRFIGGIAGSAGMNTTISNCYVSGIITGTAFMAGIAGSSSSGSLLTNNINSASIVGSASDVAGIVGRLQGSNVTYNVNTGDISGGVYVGGIVGFNYDSKNDVNNNFNIGQVTSTNAYVGSIYGGTNPTGKIKNNYYAAGLGLPGGRGNATAEGADVSGAEIVAKVTATEGVTLGLPAAPAYVWNEENYYASGTGFALDYNVPAEKVFDCYTVSNGLISDANVKEGTHILTGFTDNVVISGSYADGIVSLEGNALIADIENVTYNGLQQLPKPVVSVGEKVLVEGGNYGLSYSDDCINVGEYTVTVTGIGCYTGTLTKKFNIVAMDINTADAFDISGIDTDYPKTGAAVNPVPTITNVASNAKLVQGADYTLSYSDGCILPGTYTLSIIGKGNYTGQKDVEFVIDNTYGLTINDGTVTTGETPIYAQRADCYQKNEFKVLSNDIAAMNGNVIYGMKFYMTQKANKSFGNARFRVFLKEVEGSTSGFVGTDGATIVYDGELDVTTNEYLTINFTTPHKYNGGNLVVGIYEYEMGNSVGISFYGVTSNTGYNRGFNPYSFDSFGPSHEYKQPKTTFLYEAESTTDVDDVTVGETSGDAWYDLSGKQLENEPTEKGLYFHGNHLYMITE